MSRAIIPLLEFSRNDLKVILAARDKRCIFTGQEGTDAHEVLFKRSEKHGEGNKSRLWHPYNAVLLSNAYHIDGGATSALHALLHLQYLLNWHGEQELNSYIDWVDLRFKPANIEQWAWQRAIKIKPVEHLCIRNDALYIEDEPVENLRLQAMKGLTLRS